MSFAGRHQSVDMDGSRPRRHYCPPPAFHSCKACGILPADRICSSLILMALLGHAKGHYPSLNWRFSRRSSRSFSSSNWAARITKEAQ